MNNNAVGDLIIKLNYKILLVWNHQISDVFVIIM